MKSWLVVLVVFCSWFIQAQPGPHDPALQIRSFETLEKAQKLEARPSIIFIHTQWCRFCHGMKKNTFSNPKVISKLNANFYFAELDAEHEKSIYFLGKTFIYKPSGVATGIHELAEELGAIKGKVSFPAVVFLNQQNEILYQHAGFLSADQMLKILEKL